MELVYIALCSISLASLNASASASRPLSRQLVASLNTLRLTEAVLKLPNLDVDARTDASSLRILKQMQWIRLRRPKA